jgi:DNA invertase Pin-like site-specific DNA recombinase
MEALIYTRVSSKAQDQDNGSLEFQKFMCQEYATKNNIKVLDYFSHVISSYNKNNLQMLENKLNETKANTIIIYNISRFSRNSYNAHIFMNKYKHITLHFIEEKLVIKNSLDMHQLRSALSTAEYQSASLSDRIKKTYNYRKMNNLITVKPKYGSTVYEQNVIEFIKYARSIIVDVKTLNSNMQLLTKDEDRIIVDYFNNSEDDDSINYNTMHTLTFKNIANLLNQYKVIPIRKSWNCTAVRNIYKLCPVQVQVQVIGNNSKKRKLNIVTNSHKRQTINSVNSLMGNCKF